MHKVATTSISITPQFGNNTVTAINCGTSSPRLKGTIDISAFPNLQEFRCNSNDITALAGYAQNSNLTIVEFLDNKVTGSIPSLSILTNLKEFVCAINKLTGPIPSLNGLTNLTIFNCDANILTGPIPSLNGLTNLNAFVCSTNQLTGPIPSLNGLTMLQTFFCHSNKLTGPIPSLNGLTNLQLFYCYSNQLTGAIPSLNGLTKLREFVCADQLGTKLTGSIPSLNGLTNLELFYCHLNQLTGSIPSLNGLTKLKLFYCQINQLTGSIPSLNGLTNLKEFICNNNQFTGFGGGSVSNTLENFQAQNNQLNQSSVDAILAAFVAANRTTGTRILNVGGTGNAAPSYTGGVTTTSLGSNFTRSGTTVTANVIGHGHVTGDIVTITGIGPDTPTAPFQGTFAVTRITNNQFQYTTLSSGTATGTGTATMRKTSNPASGYASYQNLALVSRTGGPWDITINQP